MKKMVHELLLYFMCGAVILTFCGAVNSYADYSILNAQVEFPPVDEALDPETGPRCFVVQPAVIYFPQVLVDYDLTREEMCKNANVEITDKVINDAFDSPEKGQATVDLAVVIMGTITITDGIESDLRKMGLVPARVEHLLALQAEYPVIDEFDCILALGSCVTVQDKKHRLDYAPVLYNEDMLWGHSKLGAVSKFYGPLASRTVAALAVVPRSP